MVLPTHTSRLGRRWSRKLYTAHATILPTIPRTHWLLKPLSIIVIIMYCLSSASILIRWKDMEEKSFHKKASITAHIQFRSPSFRTASWIPFWDTFNDDNVIRPDSESYDSMEELPFDSQSEVETDESFPRTKWKQDEYMCLGWIATDDDGNDIGERRECWQRVRGGEAGYCEIQNTSSGEIFHVMHTTSLSLKEEVRFTCQLAKHFTDFRHEALIYQHDPPMVVYSDDEGDYTNGIAIAIYDRVVPSAFASIRQLRSTGCKLPIELWFRYDELSLDNPVFVTLMEKFGPVYLRQIYDERIEGFNVKIHAVYYSRFTNVLVLDADNFALQDPTFLFSSTQFKQHGAIFWPDFWHPGNTIFNIHAQSLIWELLDLKYVDILEQESGQVLLNRQTSQPMLEKLLFYATHKPRLIHKLQLAWGDKDLFRLAWLKMQKSFYFNSHRIPGSLGVINYQRHRFCGMSMVQYDLGGRNILFLHRNTVKLTGRRDEDKRIWQVLQEFPQNSGDQRLSLARIESFSGMKLFNETSCFGVKRYQLQRDLHMMDIAGIDIIGQLEERLIAYAQEAYNALHRPKSDPSTIPLIDD